MKVLNFCSPSVAQPRFASGLVSQRVESARDRLGANHAGEIDALLDDPTPVAETEARDVKSAAGKQQEVAKQRDQATQQKERAKDRSYADQSPASTPESSCRAALGDTSAYVLVKLTDTDGVRSGTSRTPHRARRGASFRSRRIG